MQSSSTPSLHASKTIPSSALYAVTHYYVSLPRRLVEDLRDSPAAIGAYALIARIYRITRLPVPISPGDLQIIDPSLSYGAATRALQRLVASGYVAVNRARGKKSTYVPTWGVVRGAPQLWRLDEPCLGRPRHVSALRLDQRLLDTCVGRVRTHSEHPAAVDRYFSSPLLSLEDIGSYALSLIGLKAKSEQLRWLVLMDKDGRPLPLPDDTTLLAVVSQRALSGVAADVELTPAGWARTAFAGSGPSLPSSTAALFFVPKSQIAHLIAPLIADPISTGDDQDTANAASESDCDDLALHAEGSHGPMEPESHKPSTTAECERNVGGGVGKIVINPEDPADSKKCIGISIISLAEALPVPESRSLLLSIGVRRSVVQELAAQPVDRIKKIIAEARAREDVRNLAAWVVSALRELPEEPAEAPPPPRVSDKEILLHPELRPRERQIWLQRFRAADPADRHAVLVRFRQEVDHAALP